jgi:amino acid transporter
MAFMQSAQPSSGAVPKFRRVLSLADLVVFGMAFMVPIAPFAVWGEVSAASGGTPVLSYLVGTIAMLLVAHGYAQMARRYPQAGSSYAFVSAGLGGVAGFAAGWMILLDYVLVPGLSALLGGIALSALVPNVPPALTVSLVVAVTTGLNVAGVGVSVTANRWLLGICLLALIAFVVTAVATLTNDPARGITLAPLWPEAVSLQLLLSSLSISALSFLGFDSVSTLSEEAKRPERDVPRATLLCLVLCGALFVLQVWLAEELARGGPPLAHAETAFYDLAGRAGGEWLRWCTAGAAVLITVPAALTAQAGLARVVFAMSRDRVLPGLFSRVHPRLLSPYWGALVGGLAAWLAGVAFIDRVADLIRLVSFGALTTFLLLQISVLAHVYRERRDHSWIIRAVLPLAAIVVLAVVIASLDGRAAWLGAAWALAGVVVAVAQRYRRR